VTNLAGLYVHIPYCASKCPYCDFRSYPIAEHDPSRYPAAVLAEARLRLSPQPEGDLVFRSLYVGGGTPTALPADALAGLLRDLLASLPFSSDPEVTVEANPCSLDEGMADALLAAGVNRLSLGVQSYQDPLLRTLGRAHDGPSAWEATLLAARFPRFSVDLIHAVPGQSVRMAVSDVRTAVNLGARHVSAYGLTYEPGTRVAARRARGELTAVDHETEAAMFTGVGEALESAGLARYEVSNFAVPGEESRHNLGYWRGEDYLGLGAAAHSTVAGRRWWNAPDPERYMGAVFAGGDPTEGGERLTPRDVLLERLLLGLRTRAGVVLAEILALAEEAGEPGLSGRIESELLAGRLDMSAGRVRVADRALAVTDDVIASLA